jgi:iron only hydrogenase large subunit-like protein
LIRLNGIDLESLEPEPSDGPFQAVSSAGKLFAIAGGELEATIRTIYREISKKEMQDVRINKLHGSKEVKETTFKFLKHEISFASVSGLKNAIALLDDIKSGKQNYHLIEVMVCPEGCVNGGGQPIPPQPISIKARIRAIYEADKNDPVRVAHNNNSVLKMFNEFAGSPGSVKSKELFHAKFKARKVVK